MKLIEIAQKIDKTRENESFVDITDLNDEFNINICYTDQDRLKAYFISNWLCTDSWVGYRMYFLDDEPVAVSMQEGRKSNECFEWFSKELAMKVREYLLSLNEDDVNLKFCDIFKDIGESFKIQFNEQIIHSDKAMFNGHLIKILHRIRETPDYGIDTRLKIEMANGEIKEVDITELDFKYNLIN